MSDWTAKPLLSIDTETTGVNTDEDRIVEIAAVKLDLAGEVLSQWSTVVDPGVDIPDGAAQIHGITTSRAMAEGVAPSKALRILSDLIFEAAQAGEPIVIYNATFDWPLLITECNRHGVDLYPFAAILDPLLIDRMVDRYRPGGRKLITVAAHYDVDLAADKAHGALADATAAGRIMRRLVHIYPQIGDRSLAWLWLRQVRGHEDDRVRFVDFMRLNRDPDFEKPSGWPIPVATG